MLDLYRHISPYIRLAHDFPARSFNLAPRKINDHALLYFKAGTGKFVIGKQAFSFTAGTVFLVRPHVAHSFECPAGAPQHMLNLHFDPVERAGAERIPFFQDPSRPLPRRRGAAIPVWPDSPDGLPWCLPIQATHVYERLFYRIHEAFQGASVSRLMIMKSAMIDLLAYLMSQRTSEPAITGRCVAQLTIALQAMQNQPSRHWTVEDLADAAAMSRSHFIRQFTGYYGMPPMRMLIQVRMEAAKRFLIGGQQTIKQIAGAVGFCSVHHFTRTFSRCVGISPAAFRAAYAPGP